MTLRVFCTLSTALILLPLTVSGDEFDLTDNLIVPGYRVGPVHSQCTREELGLIYGEQNLEDVSINAGEGYYMPGTVVKGGSDLEVHVIWMDEAMDVPVEISAVGTAFRTEEGIGIGTRLSELEELIGPFEMTGFGWDYAGTIFLEGTSLEEFEYGLIIRLLPDTEVMDSQQDVYRSVQSDGYFSSSDPSMQLLDPAVYDLLLRF